VPYAPESLIIAAAERLEADAHPLVVVTLMAMLRSATQLTDGSASEVTKQVMSGIPWGGAEEKSFLAEHFRLPGAPDETKPYRVLWQSSNQQEPWKSARYAETTLQRMRKDRAGKGKVFHQLKANSGAGRLRDVWGLTAAPGADLLATEAKSIRLIDLALWFGRGEDVANLDGLLSWFESVFRPDILDLTSTVLSDQVPAEYRKIPFVEEPLLDAELAERLGGTPQALPLPGDLTEIVIALEQRIKRAGFQLQLGLVRRVLTAWLRGDMVVLVGQPGTGKTRFASLLGSAMEDYLKLPSPLFVPIRSDFDEAEFVGYERLDGGQQLRPFARDVINTERPLDGHLVVLEEFNLATIETYLSSVLVASQEARRLVRLPNGEHKSLPVDTFILATCNSYIDEPETRTRVSAPAKRRAAVITMPNVLADQYDVDGEEAIVRVAVTLVKNEYTRVVERGAAGSASMFDALRVVALNHVTSLDGFSPQVKAALQAIAKSILDTPEGRSWFTMGLLRDLALAVAYAGGDAEAEISALVEAVADKLVPQLRGPHERADSLFEAVAVYPGVDQIKRLLERMKDGPLDELLPLL
jgi:MoxR-like ATPase